MYYIENFITEHPLTLTVVTEKTKSGNDKEVTAPSVTGGQYIHLHANDLGVGRNSFDDQCYHAFVLDDAFPRLQAFLEHDYSTVTEKPMGVHNDKRVRCLPAQSKAFYLCHPCIDAKKKGVKKVFQEPVYCTGGLNHHRQLLEFINELFLSERPCITKEKLQQAGLLNWKGYSKAAGLTKKKDTITPKKFFELLARNYTEYGEDDKLSPPQFTSGGLINTVMMAHQPKEQSDGQEDNSSNGSVSEKDSIYTSVDDDEAGDEDHLSVEGSTSDDNMLSRQEIRYNEGTEISKLLQAVIHCHVTYESESDETESPPIVFESIEIPTYKEYSPTPDQFCKDLLALNEDIKNLVRQALRNCNGFDIDMHVVADEVLANLIGVNNGDQGRHRDALLRHVTAFIALQNHTEPTRAVRMNPKMQCKTISDLLRMMDNQADLIDSAIYTIPHISNVNKNASEEIKLTHDITNGIQTLLLPCFQKDNAVFHHKERSDVVANSWYPCCKCTGKSSCKKSCPCHTEHDRACTNCNGSGCQNTPWERAYWQATAKHGGIQSRAKWEVTKAEKALNDAKNGQAPDQALIQDLQKQLDKAKEKQMKKEAQICQEIQEATDLAKSIQEMLPQKKPGTGSDKKNDKKNDKKKYTKRSFQFLRYGKFKMNLGDVIMVPGECLHYGVRRKDQLLLAVTVCPKYGSDIDFSQNMIAHRSLQTFIRVMELYWNNMHDKQKLLMRKRLLRWFVLFIVLQSCNQRRVSTELCREYPNVLSNIIYKIESQFLSLDDNASTKSDLTKLPAQEKECFEPEEIKEMYMNEEDGDAIDCDDLAERQYQRELLRNTFQLKPEIQDLCDRIYTYVKEEKIEQMDELFS
jgi:hypothetical protein